MKHLITFALAGAMLASTAFADSSMSPEEFFQKQTDCEESREPNECYVARYRNATEAQTTWLVAMFADHLESVDRYGAANELRSTYKLAISIGKAPGEALHMAMNMAKFSRMLE